MDKTRKKNFIYNLIYQMITIIYPLLCTPYISRVFEPDGVGIYSFSVSIVTYFTLIFLCVGKYGFREISFCKSEEETHNVFWEILILKSFIFIILSIIYVFVINIFDQYKTLLLVQFISLIHGVFDITWYLQGKENFKKTAVIGVVNKIVLLVLIFTVIKNKKDINKYAFLISFITLIGSLIMWIFTSKEIKKPKQIEIKKHILPCILLSIPFLISELYLIVDKTMLGIIGKNSFESGYYEETIKIINLLLVVITSMSIIKAPQHSKNVVENNEIELKESIINSFKYAFFVGSAITFGLYIISQRVIPAFLGVGYDKVVNLLFIYAPYVLIHSVVDIVSKQYLIPSKKQNIFTLSICMSLIINIVLNIILIKFYLSTGAIIATIVSEAILCLILICNLKKNINITNIFGIVYKYLISGIAMFIVLFIINNIIIIDNFYIYILVEIFVGAIIYFGCLLFLKDKFFIGIVKKIFIKGDK